MCPYLVPILLERSLSPIEIVLTSSPQSKILFSQPLHIHCFAQLIQCKWHKNTAQCTLYDTLPSCWKLPVREQWESLSIPNWMNFWGILLLMFLYTGAIFDREIVSTWWDLLCNLTLRTFRGASVEKKTPCCMVHGFLNSQDLRSGILKSTGTFGPWC